jgi:putative membrane protein
MKKSEPDFSIPTRQSYVAILLILGRTTSLVFRQLIPILLVVMFRKTEPDAGPPYFTYAGLAVILLVMIWSAANFYMSWFVVKDGELIVHSGIFQRKKTVIPLDRIQTVHFEQNFIHQLFDVHRVKMETAGSEKNEVSFQALSQENAFALRALTFHGSIENDAENAVAGQEGAIEYDTVSSVRQPAIPWVKHDLNTLLKVGLTQQHLRSGALILVFIFWIFENIQQAGIELDSYAENVEEWNLNLWLLAFFLLFLSVVIVGISLVMAILLFWDLRFSRVADGFILSSGLFTRKEKSARDHKIQYIQWSDNLLKKAIGHFDLELFQAAGHSLSRKQRIFVPGCINAQVDDVAFALFGLSQNDFTTFLQVSSVYFYRFAVLVSIGFALGISIFVYGDLTSYAISATFLLIFLLVTRFLAWKKCRYSFVNDVLYLKKGVFATKDVLMPVVKLQAVKLRQSIYQRRQGLCDVLLYTASGTLRIPYITYQEGMAIVHRMLMITTADTKQSWM